MKTLSKRIMLLSLLCLWALADSSLNAQHMADEASLFETLKAKDSLLFNIGFNTCKIEIFEALIAEDFEFYHDQSGITPSQDAFLEGTRNGLCKLDYQPIRKLVPGSLEVFPLKNNGVIYGALQTGRHRFYALYPHQKEMKPTSEALFNHLWLLNKDGEWQVARVVSYQHRPLEE